MLIVVLSMKQWFEGRGVRILPVISSLVTGLAFLDVRLGFLVFIGVLPFIWYTRHAKELSSRQIIFDCCFAAFVFALIASCWILQTVPSNWVPIFGTEELVAKTLVWVWIAAFSSLSFGIVLGLLVAKMRKSPTRLLILLPLVWILAELTRSFTLALFLYGPDASLGPNWNYGSLGLGVASTPLAYISRFVGLHGLTAVAILVNVSIYLALQKRYLSAMVVVGMLVVVNVTGWKLYQPDHSRSLHVAAYNLKSPTPSHKEWEGVRFPSKDVDLLVLPEYSNMLTYSATRELAISHFEPKTIIITSEGGQGDRPQTNDLVAYSGNGSVISRQSKTFLAPFGEYLPYATTKTLEISGQHEVLERFKNNSQVRRGDRPERTVSTEDFTVGSLVCSGTLNLGEYRRLANQGADVLTNSASLALLKEASLYRVQEYYQNRLHAVANAKPFVQSTRSGVSYVISSDGKLLVSTDRQGFVETTVQLQPKRTIYTIL